MFEFLRRSPSVVQKRPGWSGSFEARPRSRSTCLRFESLESRALLSAAPSGLEDALDLRTLPTAQYEAVSLSALVALEAHSRGILIRPELPDRWSVLPVPPADDAPIWNDWPELPPLGDQKPSLPEDASPDPYDPGGFSEIGDLDSTELSETKSGGVPDNEARDVLATLAALQYVPAARPTEETDQDEPAAAYAQTQSPISATNNQLLQTRFEGGMISLSRGAVGAELESEDGQQPQIDAAPRIIPIQMDRVFGQFQAFEVSTTEVLTTAAPASREATDPISLPPAADAVSPPSGTAETEAAPPTTRATTNPESAEENSRHSASFTIFPIARDLSSSPTLFAAAASLIFAYVAQASRSGDSREPDRQRDSLRLTFLYLDTFRKAK